MFRFPLVVLMSLLLAAPSAAAPILVTANEFAAAAARLDSIVDDFESYTPGDQPNPFTIANGTFEHIFALPQVAVSDSPTICGADNQCLAGGISGTRTFTNFPMGTTYWAADIRKLTAGTLVDSMIVTGVGGTLVVNDFVVPSFLGISDDQGLLSIDFYDSGGGFISYDNVTVLVPEPSTITLLGMGLALACFARVLQRLAPR